MTTIKLSPPQKTVLVMMQGGAKLRTYDGGRRRVYWLNNAEQTSCTTAVGELMKKGLVSRGSNQLTEAGRQWKEAP